MANRHIAAFLIGLATLGPTAARADTETAVFAGGCFWCVESDMDKVKGVTATVSGFAGGTRANPTYDDHTGYTEAVEVTFDPAIVSYATLAGHFLRTIDVTDAGGQFCDRGESYVSALFVTGKGQRIAAEKAAKLASQSLGKEIVTPVRPVENFVAAGPEHQDYYKGGDRKFTRFGLITQADAYKRYRKACGRDDRVRAVWGDLAYGFPQAGL